MRKRENKRSNKKAIIGIIFALIVIFSLFGKKDEKEHKQNNTEVAQASTITSTKETVTDKPTKETDTMELDGVSYKVISVDGGDRSGNREPNVAVDIGYGDRQYWAFTNEYGQLVNVKADKITLQDDAKEPVNSSGRYYNDEANVPGTEREDLDQGHVIADSLGGVSNAYNITPQDSTLNRHGNQSYMEKVIRDAGSCENFIAVITYPDTETQIPSHYHYEYTLNGEHIVDDFDNVNPDVVNATLQQEPEQTNSDTGSVANTQDEDLSSVDTNGNGKVTIGEAKAAGYSMPITSDHWLYKYMDDRDGDGMVGE